MGLKQRIAAAKTVTEVDLLLAEGAEYKHAAPKTMKQWHRTADMRRRLIREGKVESK